MNKVFFISDLHLSHFNIMKYEPCRVEAIIDFLISRNLTSMTAEELRENFAVSMATGIGDYFWIHWHNEMLITYWNETVDDNDVVWFLGDFAFKNNETAKEIGHRLKGHKRMVQGNHDRETLSFYYSCGFEYVSSYPIILKKKFLLSHAPFEKAGELFNIYGHVHSHEGFKTSTANSHCVCVERQGFKPIQIREFDTYKEEKDTNPARERNRK